MTVCLNDLNGNVIKQNFHYRYNANPHILQKDRTKYLQIIYTYANILRDKLVVPVFLHQNFTGDIYVDLL